jgi:7-cyano-7-deazaguanine synthase
MSKSDIIKAGMALGVDFSMTCSCYDPGPNGEPCGGCDACVLRAQGFAASGIPDPLGA